MGRDKHGSTVIEWAGGMGRLDVINWAISCLPPPDATATPRGAKRKRQGGPSSSSSGNNKNRKREGRTFLHFACQYGRIELVEAVLEDVRAKGGESEVSGACAQGENCATN